MKKTAVFFVAMFTLALQANPESFIVKKDEEAAKKLSRNRLKENIGQNVKKTLHQCSELNKQIGQIQIQLSDIQKNLFEKVEELIDNKHPFKKASRAILTDSFKVMQSVAREFDVQLVSIKKISNQINKDGCLKKTAG